MSIRTKLFVIAVIPILFFLVAFFSQGLVARMVERANSKAIAANELHAKFSALAFLTLEHYAFYENRSHGQWEKTYEEISARLKKVDAVFTDDDEHVILDQVARHFRTIGYLFSQYGPHTQPGRPIDKRTEWQQFADLLTSRILQELEIINPQLDRLHEINHQEALRAERILDRLGIISFLTMALGIPVFSYLVYRSLAYPLQRVHEGIGIISAGNLNHRLDISSRDEIGRLAEEFNVMTERRQDAEEKLKRVNAELESRVAKRTAELSILNDDLLQEIEERKQAEKALRDSEARYRTLFDNAGDGIMILDLEGRILALNQVFCDRLGYREDELLGKTPRDIDPPEYRPQVPERIRAINERRNVIFESAHVRKDGSVMPVEINSRLVDYDGRPAIMSVVRDITLRKEAEAELRRLKEAAEDASRAKSEFIANVSHEIRTPMNAIIGLGHLALQSDPDPKQKYYLDQIGSAARSLLMIINDILDFSKIEADRLQLEEIDFAIADIFEHLAEMGTLWAGEKELEICCGIAPEIPPFLVGDPLRLTQILTNLLNNAVKFTEKGEITVTAAPAGEPAADHSLMVAFTVADTGIGIPGDRISSLFLPFTQADSSTSRKYGGTGLGLSISKSLADLMGGRIEASSTPGRGSSFTVTVPLRIGTGESSARINALPVSAAGSEGAELLRGARILVAEDNGINQTVIRELLRKVGIEAVVVAGGREAVAAVSDMDPPFDAVLMDIQMPEMDGYEATARIREITDSLPVIAMTAHVSPEKRERCRAVGMNAHLEKPVFAGKLYATLLAFVRPRSSGEPDFPVPAEGAPFPRKLPGIDLVDAMERYDRDTELFRKILLLFGEEKQCAREEIAAAISGGDWEKAERLAHGLKGIAGNISATRLHNCAARLEKAIVKRNDVTIPGLLDQLGKRLEEVLAATSSLRETLPG